MEKRHTGKTVRNLLSATKLKSKKPGMHADGGNLYLQVKEQSSGERSRSWVFRYMAADSRRREMGLGPLVDVSLANARAKAAEHRNMLRDGMDPLQERRRKRYEAVVSASRAITFRRCCEAYIEAHAAEWRNEKHHSQWQNTLATYADPIIGSMLVSDIGTDHVMAVLKPIWNTKHETARRLRARIERVLSWATTLNYRSGDNAAQWEGNLKNLLAVESKTQPVKHHAALSFRDIHDFTLELRKQSGIAAIALEFTILTATRTSEVINATWDEIDFKRKEWSIPAERMKSGKPHRVPLSNTALAVLKRADGTDEQYIFPGKEVGLSNMAMLALLKRMGRKDITVHGFRSTFRDWAAEQTAYANHVVEMALAHTISDQVEKAYRRGELLEKRTYLMEDWARYIGLSPATGNVSNLRGVR